MILSTILCLLAIGFAPLTVFAKHFAVTGVKVEDGADIPARLNINSLYSNGGPQWDIYLRALKSMQDKDAADPLSYFQIAGIHGMPYREWQNGGAFRGTSWAGYCPHGESLFLPWHRPFVLVFEQVLVAEAKKIAATYPDKYRSQYMDAANKLRSPFWDWSYDYHVPPCTVPQTMTVNVPDGQNLKQITIDNPLRTYKYPAKARQGQFGSFPNYESTSRCPSPNNYPDSANQKLASRGLMQTTYDSFTYSGTFNEFANTRDDGIGIEQIHNNIHWDAGCAGQFLDSRVAGFDALFMLHHTHVDRLLAYWGFINPSQAMFTYSYYGQSRYSTPDDTIISPNSPLQPFYDDNDTYWTPKKVASIKGMGYTYEGLEYWKKSPNQLRNDAMALINSLYSPNSARRRNRRAAPEAKTRYFAHIQLDRQQVERPCTVKIFVDGKVAGNVVVMQLPESGILQGRVAVDEEVRGAFTTTRSSNGTVGSIEHLVEMEIMKPDGKVIPLNTVPSLKLTLEEVSVAPANSSTEFPKKKGKKLVAAALRDRQKKTTKKTT